nr:transposase [Hydrogenibacillus sp. N12]
MGAGIVFQHPSIESLRRELSRNGQLRSICGLRAVPSAAAYIRFFRRLMTHGSWIESMFDELVKALSQELPEFGRRLVMDRKAIASWASRPSKEKEADGRRDLDAEYGTKTYRRGREDGTIWEKGVRWFGYKLHLVVDAKHELPVAYTGTKGSRSDVREACPIGRAGETTSGDSEGGVRVALAVDRRICTPIARESYIGTQEYRGRTRSSG